MNKKAKTLLIAITGSMSFLSVSAQPTLTAATTTPVAGETFYGHVCNPTGVSIGASGAGVTWDFSTLNQMALDTTHFETCSSTPYCDSFSGSNLAVYEGNTYGYFIAAASGMTEIGSYGASFGYEHLSDPQEILFYPMTYMSSHSDDAAAVLNASPAILYLSLSATSNIDAWGTLMLPGATYTNVLRLHRVTLITDSFVITGSPSTISHSELESYDWFVSGFHAPLLDIDLDTAGTGTLHATSAKYTNGASVAIQDMQLVHQELLVYPDPATNVVNMKFTIQSPSSSAITIVDITGRTVASISGNTFTPGLNSINFPVTELPSGMYIIHLQTANGTVMKKFLVNR